MAVINCPSFHMLLATRDAIHEGVADVELQSDYHGLKSIRSEFFIARAVRVVRCGDECLCVFWNKSGTGVFGNYVFPFIVVEVWLRKILLKSSGAPTIHPPASLRRDVLNWERLLRWHNDGNTPFIYADWLNDHNLGEREAVIRKKYEEWIPEDTNPAPRR